MPTKYHLWFAMLLHPVLVAYAFYRWGADFGVLSICGSVWMLCVVRAYAKGRVTAGDAAFGVLLQLSGVAVCAAQWSVHLAVFWFLVTTWVSALVRAFVVVEGWTT